MRSVLEVNGEPLFAHQLRSRPMEDVIDGLLMRQEARRLKLMLSAEEIDSALARFAARPDGSEGCRADVADTQSREEFAGRLMVDRLLARWLGAVRSPKIHEMRDYYRRHENAFRVPESVWVSHIVQGGPATAAATAGDLEEFRERILGGTETFGDLARRVSDCPENEGDLGVVPRGVMVEEFDAIAFRTPVGEISQPFRTVFGWHILWVRDRWPERGLTFEEATGQIREALLRELQEREVTAKLMALRKRARVVEIQQ